MTSKLGDNRIEECMEKMNKEDILMRSKQEYEKNPVDEGEMECINRANRLGVQIFTWVGIALMLIDSYQGKTVSNTFGLLGIFYATNSYAKYLHTREKKDFIWTIVFAMCSILNIVAYIINVFML